MHVGAGTTIFIEKITDPVFQHQKGNDIIQIFDKWSDNF